LRTKAEGEKFPTVSPIGGLFGYKKNPSGASSRGKNQSFGLNQWKERLSGKGVCLRNLKKKLRGRKEEKKETKNRPTHDHGGGRGRNFRITSYGRHLRGEDRRQEVSTD